MSDKQKIIIGWREWTSLPDLNVPGIKVKVDTGARTSALHAFGIKPFEKNNEPWIEFYLHPIQRHRKPEIKCESKILETRTVTSSNGQKELRYVIQSTISLGGENWPIEITLTNRDEMGFRMLLGRQALQNILVDPSKSFQLGKFNDYQLYQN